VRRLRKTLQLVTGIYHEYHFVMLEIQWGSGPPLQVDLLRKRLLRTLEGAGEGELFYGYASGRAITSWSNNLMVKRFSGIFISFILLKMTLLFGRLVAI